MCPNFKRFCGAKFDLDTPSVKSARKDKHTGFGFPKGG